MTAHSLSAPDELVQLAGMVATWQSDWTTAWHGSARIDTADASPFRDLVREQHRRNFDLWHQEDKARSPEASDSIIANVKRRIDKLNQERNDLIEQIDFFLQAEIGKYQVDAPSASTWNTETAGAVIDRLSILSLKVYHMREQAERTDASAQHRATCEAKLRILEQQRGDLAQAFLVLVDDLFAGRKVLKVYRQFKMYNDPALNPEIYRLKNSASV